MKKRESLMLMMELMIAIVIFLLASSVCLFLFARAHTANKESRELSAAALEERNIAELVSSAKNLVDAGQLIASAYPEAEQSSTGSGITVRLAFDKDLQPIYAGSNSAYLLTAELTWDGEMLATRQHFYSTGSSGSITGKSVYDLDTRTVPPGAEGGEES